MNRFIDETGKQYGRLRVLSRSDNNKCKKTVWLCKCDCGNQVQVLAESLRRSKTPTRSCGCLHKEAIRQVGLKNKGTKRSMWNKGLIVSSQGYVVTQNREGKFEALHRITVEHAIERSLKSDEVVHHINGNKLDNRNCNLLVCDKPYHAWLHQRMAQKYMQEKFG